MKKLILIPILAMVFLGCAPLTQAIGKVLPTVEAKAGANGIGINIDPNLGVNYFCLDAEGKVAGVLNKVPVLGSVMVDLIGTCDTVTE